LLCYDLEIGRANIIPAKANQVAQLAVFDSNPNALIAKNPLTRNAWAMDTVIERLSNGQRSNSASDDTAGLEISS